MYKVSHLGTKVILKGPNIKEIEKILKFHCTNLR